jgi:hypothetical protein
MLLIGGATLRRARWPIEVRPRGVRRLGERDRVPIRVGDVHVADTVRIGLDRFVLDSWAARRVIALISRAVI